MQRHPHVVNVDELEWKVQSHGEKFGCKRAWLGASAGAVQLGCGAFEVAPGKRAFPFHSHATNEEAVFVLQGEGTLRLGADSVAIRAGDYIAFPADVELAHQIINTGQAPLRYLCLSTQRRPEICRYPDSGKVGLYVGAPDSSPPGYRKLQRETDSVDYYDGEDT